MAAGNELAIDLLRRLSEGEDWAQARRALGLDEAIARRMLADVADRLGRPTRRRRSAAASDEERLPEPPADSPFPPESMVIAHADGASRGNPGPASYGCVYLGPDGEPAFGEAAAIGVATNNVAEYRGCLAALQRLHGWGVQSAIVRLDSQLVVRQLSGQYRVKDATLKGWYDEVRKVARGFQTLRFEHVPRKENAAADRMANLALDAASG